MTQHYRTKSSLLSTLEWELRPGAYYRRFKNLSILGIVAYFWLLVQIVYIKFACLRVHGVGKAVCV